MGHPSRALHACIDETTLAAFADGVADETAHGRVEEHLAECVDCRTVLTRLTAVLHSRVGRSSASGGPPPAGQGEVRPGTPVGRYVVDGLIGRGAMGTVYAARDPDLDRTVALKLLRSGSLSEVARQRVRARLLREAKAMARLSHPEVITVYDVGAFGDQLFVAMEYVDGGTLRQWRAATHRGCREILAVYERAGSGLAAAHEAGLVHRDFKPDNVLVGRDGRVRVTDFGLARTMDAEPSGALERGSDAVDPAGSTTTLTRTGTLLGTPAYMAPEQLRARPADARSDVFSFCVALYEALYGERPFPGRSVRELEAAIEGGHVRAAPLMGRVPRWLRGVLLRGLRADPDQRFPSMRELLDALRAGHATHVRRVAGVFAVAAGAAGAVALAVMTEAHARQGVPPFPRPDPSELRVSNAAQVVAASAAPAGESLRPPAAVAPTGRLADEVARRRPTRGTDAAASEPSALPAARRIPPKVQDPRLAPAGAGDSTEPQNAANGAPQVGHNGALILE